MGNPVKLYNIIPGDKKRWIIIGKNREYFLTEFSCTCKSFQLITSKKEKKDCKHLVLLKNAIESFEYDIYNITIPEYKNLRPYLLQIKK